MPIYEYKCSNCHYQFERMQSFKDEPISECPQCGHSVRRLIQPVGIVFKGSGFYITDNRQVSSGANGRSKPKELPERASESKTEPKAEPKKESTTTAPATD